MKLAYVVKEFPRFSETFILNELLELERAGHELVVFSRHNPSGEVPHAALRGLRAEVVQLQPLLFERFWEPFAIHLRLGRRVGERLDRSLQQAVARRSKQEMRYWLVAAAVAERVLDDGIELIHGHFATGSASVARYAALIAGCEFTFTAHAKDIYADVVDRERLRALLRDAAAAVTVSDVNKDFLQQLEPRARVERVYNGLDLERFPVRAERVPADPPLLLSIGRMVPKKGLPVLLEAAARLARRGRAFRLRFVGGGPEEPSLVEQAARLGLADRVQFAGPASQEEIVDRHLAEADLFVAPSVIAPDGDRDGLPTTLVEAMACGVPVVSTRVTGIPEAVADGESGLLAEPGDADSLAEAIEATLADREAARRRARAARRCIEERFDVRTNVAALAELFDEIGAPRAREAAGA